MAKKNLPPETTDSDEDERSCQLKLKRFLESDDAKDTFIKMAREEPVLFVHSLGIIKNQDWLDETMEAGASSNPDRYWNLCQLVEDPELKEKLVKITRQHLEEALKVN